MELNTFLEWNQHFNLKNLFLCCFVIFMFEASVANATFPESHVKTLRPFDLHKAHKMKQKFLWHLVLIEQKVLQGIEFLARFLRSCLAWKFLQEKILWKSNSPSIGDCKNCQNSLTMHVFDGKNWISFFTNSLFSGLAISNFTTMCHTNLKATRMLQWPESWSRSPAAQRQLRSEWTPPSNPLGCSDSPQSNLNPKVHKLQHWLRCFVGAGDLNCGSLVLPPELKSSQAATLVHLAGLQDWSHFYTCRAAL